jgi:3-dehydroquinate synthase
MMIDWRTHTVIFRPFGTAHSHPVYTINNFPSTLPDELPLPNGRAVIVADMQLPEAQISEIGRLFCQGRPAPAVVKVDLSGGKDLKALTSICQALVDLRPGLIVGVGGGTVRDLSGFAAAIYRRGSPYVLFPTTTVAMVDACIGGKTAIDFGGTKNILGAFHHPLGVINILSFLDTLPDHDLRSGLVEVAKIGVVANAALVGRLRRWAASPTTIQRQQLASLVSDACAAKARVLEQPPEHHAIPMYGHVVGEAIELIGWPRRRHTDCVAIGMSVEGLLACQLGYWPQGAWEEQMQLLGALRLDTRIPADVSLDAMVESLHHDKLATEEHFRFVLPAAIGEVARPDGTPFIRIPRTAIRKALAPVFAALTGA